VTDLVAQIVGCRWHDDVVLRVARAVESVSLA
jgi:hypothetical protein